MTPSQAIRLRQSLWTTTARERLVVWQVFEPMLFWPTMHEWLDELGHLIGRVVFNVGVVRDLQEDVLLALEARVTALGASVDTGDLFNHQGNDDYARWKCQTCGVEWPVLYRDGGGPPPAYPEHGPTCLPKYGHIWELER